jgi:SPP1 gp7 family putative phage head morphogenesis protein
LEIAWKAFSIGRSSGKLRPTNQADTYKAWTSKIADTLAALQNGSLTPSDLDIDLFTATKTDILNGVAKGFKADFNNISYDHKDYTLMAKLRTNVYKFAGAKTYQQLRAFNDMLLTPDSSLVSFGEFKRNAERYQIEALKVDKLYNTDWLQTEYNLAIGQSQQAAVWNRAIENSDIFPNLRYRTAGDARVREVHKVLDGIVRPINDPFWKTYNPKNDYGCRCYSEPTDDPETWVNQSKVLVDKDHLPDIDDMFAHNVGTDGNPFYKHPFYTRNNIDFADVVDKTNQFALKEQIEMNKAVWDSYKNDDNYVRKYFDNETGGFHIEHANAQKLKSQEQQAIDVLILKGKRVVRPEYSEVRYSKNFDCTINESLFDLKNIEGSANSVMQSITGGSKQARNLVLTVANYNKANTVEGIKEGYRKIKEKDRKINAILLIIDGKIYTTTYLDFLSNALEALLP